MPLLSTGCWSHSPCDAKDERQVKPAEFWEYCTSLSCSQCLYWWHCLVGQLTALKPCVRAALSSPGSQVRPGAGGGLQEAAAPASAFGSTANTEREDLSTGIN